MSDLAPADVARLLPKHMTAEMTTGGAFVETFYRKYGGRIFAAEVSSQMITMGGETLVLLYIRDITQRKQAAEALRDSEERYRSLVETSPDAIALTDLRGRILICNQKAADICEYDSPEQMIGMSVFLMLAPEDRPRALENARKLYRGGDYRDIDYTAVTRNGRRFPCELSATHHFQQAGAARGLHRHPARHQRAQAAGARAGGGGGGGFGPAHCHHPGRDRAQYPQPAAGHAQFGGGGYICGGPGHQRGGVHARGQPLAVVDRHAPGAGRGPDQPPDQHRAAVRQQRPGPQPADGAPGADGRAERGGRRPAYLAGAHHRRPVGGAQRRPSARASCGC